MPSAPEPIRADHVVEGFRCGVASLDAWLRHRALRNQVTGASRTFVACESGNVLAYYALASGAVAVSQATGRVRRNMHDPVPVVVLARLAVSVDLQGRGLGRALFQDAALRVLDAAAHIGVRALLVHATSDDARRFYVGLGLEPSPLDPMTLMATLQDLQSASGRR
jgi:GNAT superfamily N-acetyltransferase